MWERQDRELAGSWDQLCWDMCERTSAPGVCTREQGCTHSPQAESWALTPPSLASAKRAEMTWNLESEGFSLTTTSF